jgi:hypothetical protein
MYRYESGNCILTPYLLHTTVHATDPGKHHVIKRSQQTAKDRTSKNNPNQSEHHVMQRTKIFPLTHFFSSGNVGNDAKAVPITPDANKEQ